MAVWQKKTNRVCAHVLTSCSELIAYRSPAWRSAMAMADGPDNYHDGLVLRSRKKRSRFVVVYEIGRPTIKNVEYRAEKAGPEVDIQLKGGQRIEIVLPEIKQGNSQEDWRVRWRKK